MRTFLHVGLRVLAVAAFAVGVVFGSSIFGTLFSSRSAEAARNAGGTYSLPSGNPVVAGTTISASWANTTLSDLGTEITDSLNRSGKGAMLAPLQLSNGTSSLPSLTFGSETSSGLYRAGSQDVRLQLNATMIQKWASNGVIITPSLSVENGLAATQATLNSPAVVGTGNGTAAGVTGTGGSTSGAGVSGTGGSSNGVGVVAAGTGSGNGITATGGSSNGVGIVATGGGSTGGGSFANGTAATASTRQVALAVTNGDINLNGVANPNSNVAMLNKLAPANLVKAWAKIQAGLATPLIDSGFNIASVSCSASDVTLVFAQAMANTNYVTIVTPDQPVGFASAFPLSTTQIQISVTDHANAAVDLCAGTVTNLHVMAIGIQ